MRKFSSKWIGVMLVLGVLMVAGCGGEQVEVEEEVGAEVEAEVEAEDVSEENQVTDEGRAMLMHEGTLTIGVEIGYPPFEDFADDGTTPIGYDIDFAYALADKLGLEVNFINTAWDGIFQGIDVNYDCVISAVTITPERMETMLFSLPYINNYQAIVVHSDYEGVIEDFLDLDGLSVAVQKETTSDVLISDYVATGSINCTVAQNEKIVTCFTQLTNGEIDAVVVDSTVADGYLASNPDQYVKVFQDDSEPEQFGVAMGLDNIELQSAIDAAIEELEAEGFFVDNVAHWFGAEE